MPVVEIDEKGRFSYKRKVFAKREAVAKAVAKGKKASEGKPWADYDPRNGKGRNSSFTHQRAEEALKYFRMGMNTTDVCKCLGIDVETFNRFCDANPGSKQYFKSQGQAANLIARKQVLKAISGDVSKGVNPDLNLARWWLEKKQRHEFGSDAYVMEVGRLDAAAEATEAGGAPGHVSIPAELVAPEFANFFRDVKDHKFTHYREPGGRGAGRSSAISLALVNLLVNHPEMHALVARKVGKTVRDSVFAQIIWALDALGVQGQFKVNRSLFLITRIATGQNIYFRGLDDPYKIKSIKPPFGYIGAFWLEEADQTNGEAELRPVRQSIMRGGESYWIFESWNTPRSKQHWINKRDEEDRDRPDVRRHHSTYQSLPVAWLGQPFLDEAEALKRSDHDAYRHEYLGEAIGYGGEIFERLSLERISDETIATFDNVKRGLDWGFTVDPLAFVKCHYDKTRKVLYVFDEFVANNLTDDDTARLLGAHGVKPGDVVTADCSEPKSIDNMRRKGFNLRGCTKFNGSVEFGVKWMQALTLIVIDPARCPVAAREFAGYSLKRDADGKYLPTIVRVEDHVIDAARYSLDDEIMAGRPTTTSFASTL